MKRTFFAVLTLAGCLSLVSVHNSTQAHQRFPNLHRRNPGHPFVRLPNRPKITADPATLQLVRKMLRPTENFSGEQVTEVTEHGGRQSRQRIWGDTRGRLRRDYLSPGDLNGDVMITAAEQYRYFHHRADKLDIALWPDQHEQEKILPTLIQQRRVLVERVGQETIAGRTADIVAIELDGNASGRQIKFWIDTETGIRLKQEMSNQGGLISRSYLTSVVVGAAAGVDNKTFELPFPNAKINQLFPPTSHYSSIEEARSVLPFSPALPMALPQGYTLTGVWVFPSRNRKQPEAGTVLLRYGNGVEIFSLYEKYRKNPLPVTAKTPKVNRRNVVRWGITGQNNGTLELTYVGYLSPTLAQQLVDGLH